LDAAHLSFRTTPGHVDGAAGLKPLGDYYLYQALLVLLPAAFLLACSLILLIPSWDRRCDGWRGWFLGLLCVSICVEVDAFVAPRSSGCVALEGLFPAGEERLQLVAGSAVGGQRLDVAPVVGQARLELGHGLLACGDLGFDPVELARSRG